MESGGFLFPSLITSHFIHDVNALIAQSVEHSLSKRKVGSSILP